LATTFFSIFLGWLRIRTGDVWSASVAHGANNVTEDRWHRLAFTGDAAGTPSLAADGTLLLAEAIVLLGVVGLAERRSVKRQNQPLAIPPGSGLARNHQEAA
jgi:membrane protease YdiL (CAAX protease family)